MKRLVKAVGQALSLYGYKYRYYLLSREVSRPVTSVSYEVLREAALDLRHSWDSLPELYQMATAKKMSVLLAEANSRLTAITIESKKRVSDRWWAEVLGIAATDDLSEDFLEAKYLDCIAKLHDNVAKGDADAADFGQLSVLSSAFAEAQKHLS